MKKCSFCSDETEESAQKCKNCGKDFILDLPLVFLEQKKDDLNERLTQSKKDLVDSKAFLKEEIQYSEKGASILSRAIWIIIAFIASLSSEALGVCGGLVITLAILDIIRILIKRRQSRHVQTEIKLDIKNLRKQIVDIKAELAALDEKNNTEGD